MAKFPTIEEMARDVAEKALDEYEYNGKTLREWIEIILATDTNVGTKDGTNLAEVGTKIEPLTDKEQRIFLAAMGREREVCKEVDDQYTHEPYEVMLTKVCSEIERKVKAALWS